MYNSQGEEAILLQLHICNRSKIDIDPPARRHGDRPTRAPQQERTRELSLLMSSPSPLYFAVSRACVSCELSADGASLSGIDHQLTFTHHCCSALNVRPAIWLTNATPPRPNLLSTDSFSLYFFYSLISIASVTCTTLLLVSARFIRHSLLSIVNLAVL